MVSKASELLPLPDSPVITVSRSRGISTSTFLRLCSRAPRTIRLSSGIRSSYRRGPRHSTGPTPPGARTRGSGPHPNGHANLARDCHLLRKTVAEAPQKSLRRPSPREALRAARAIIRTPNHRLVLRLHESARSGRRHRSARHIVCRRSIPSSRSGAGPPRRMERAVPPPGPDGSRPHPHPLQKGDCIMAEKPAGPSGGARPPTGRSKIPRDAFVSKVAPDPANLDAASPRVLLGYVGDSDEEGYTRIYCGSKLDDYVDVR